jgi:aerobic carbon-monoxide dehydrogenase medium subunit
MRPAPFVYHAPRDVDAAIALLAEHGDEAKVLAGGQSLVPMLALRLAAPGHLVDLGRVDELKSLTFDDGVRIGAGVTQRAVERAAPLARACPLLAEALPCIAHPPIRNRGTVCGSLAHADPAAELPAVMLALDAALTARGPHGSRDISARDFFTSYLETTLDVDEVLTHVQVPAWHPGAGWSFVELSRRSGDFAIAGVAAIIVVVDGIVRSARLAACGVASTPVRLVNSEAVLVGRQLDDTSIREAAEAATVGLEPPSDVHAPAAYRRQVTNVLVQRALRIAATRVGAS